MSLQCVVHYPRIQFGPKIIPLDDHKFKVLLSNKEARGRLGDENAHEEQRKTIPSAFDANKHGAHSECYKKFTMGTSIEKRK